MEFLEITLKRCILTAQGHYLKVEENNLPPSVTLAKAIALFDKEKVDFRIVTDLGCGTGIDTSFLLENKWEVIAIDNQTQAIT